MAAIDANVAMKTAFKMLYVPSDGKISREHFEKYATRLRNEVKNLNPVEAEKVYHAVMAISDVLGLDKNAKDGGMSYTIREAEIARRVAAHSELPEASRVLSTALFKAINTKGDQHIQKSEWSAYLKVRNTYTSEEQAQQSFDSIDKNKDGKLSLEEFNANDVDFWCNLGEELESQDLFGTKSL